MFVPIGRNTLIFIPMVRRTQQTKATVRQPVTQTEIRIIRYGTLFISILIIIGALISWYDSTH